MTRDDIFFKDGRLCIHLTDDEGAMKGFETPKNKMSALLYHNAQMIEVNWIGIQIFDGRVCLAFYENELITELPSPLRDISTTLRPYCFEILRRVSHALEEAEGKLYTNLDSVPLSNVLVFPNGDILVLTSQLGDIIDRFEIDAERHEDKEIWYAHNCVNNFGKANFLFQILYYALSGKAPFEAPEVRENGFKAVPLALAFPPGNERLALLCKDVDLALSDNRKFQFGIKKPYAYFRQILDKYSDIDVASVSVGPNPELPAYWAKVEKRAKRSAFFRTKGFRTFMIVLASLAVAWVIAFYVWRAVKPPLTRDLNEAQIIDYYFDALNDLDVTAMEEPLKNGYDGPHMTQVTTIYVTKSMQITYSGYSLVINPNDWIANGMGPLAEGSMVFGVTDVAIEKISDDVYRATVTSWSSENYLDETNSVISEDGMEIYQYREVYEFTFKTRGSWREISKIEPVSIDLVKTYHVEYQK